MSIITKCPGCGTTFRVTPVQLQAQHGMVRCGRCAHVFDGFKTLATMSDGAPDAADVADRELPAVDAMPPPAAVVAAPEPVALPESTTELPAPVAPPPVQSAAVTPAPPPFALPPAEAEPAAQRRSGSWAFGAVLLLVGLGLQAAYFYRSELAASVPEARPYLAKMCEPLRCTVHLPQRPRQISIEASDMQATDPATPGLIALTATLRNQATIELGYPALDVVLTNAKEHTVARRIFVPAEYLVAGKDARAGIPPNAEFTVRLDLDTGDLGAAGFRLDLIAAPVR